MKKIIDRTLYLLLLIAVFFLSFRIILELLNANPQTFFTAFIYLISTIILIPFQNIFPPVVPPATGSFLDTSAFFSLIAYIVTILSLIGGVHIVHGIITKAKSIREGEENEEESLL